MASVTYLGKNGGSNAEFEAAKVEALAIQNELNRLKLEKLRAALIERDQVELVIADALVILRERILSLPRQLVGLLRGMEHAKLHAIRMDLEQTVRRFLCELIIALERAPNPQEALKALMEDDDGAADDRMEIIRRDIRHEAVSARRRKKRAAEKT